MNDTAPATIALMVFLAGTFAAVAYAWIWAVTSHRPVRVNEHMTGRAAAPYWYTATGRQDERGIVARPTRN